MSKVSQHTPSDTEADIQFEGYEVAMVEGKIAFQMGSTVPTLERAELVLPRKEEEVEVKQEPVDAGAAQVVEADSKIEIENKEALPADETSGQVEADTEEEPKSAPIAIADDDRPSPPKRPRRTPASRPVHPLPSSLFIGDLRLTVLRTRLQALTPPMPAEFAGSGILVCGPGVLALADQGVVKAGSIVAVRKGDSGVEIEGSVGSVYDLVKKEVYGSFAQVSAA
jgi:cleavage and polyadenylation specificity factor subunit 2